MEPTVTMNYYKNFIACLAYLHAEADQPRVAMRAAIDLLKKYGPAEYTNGCLLDLGIGTSVSTQVICSTFGIQSIIGVDSSMCMLQLAKHSCHANGINLYPVEADLHSDTITAANNVADVGISIGVMSYLRSIDNVLTEASRLLKPRAPFVFTLDTVDVATEKPFEYLYNAGHMLYIPSYESVIKKMGQVGFELQERMYGTLPYKVQDGCTCSTNVFACIKK